MTPNEVVQMNLHQLETLDPQHRNALKWFHTQSGQELPWPQPLDGMYLVNKAKGIQKPTQLQYALSVRQSLTGPYGDKLHWSPEGSWFLHYDYESNDPALFTNRGLKSCMEDGVPVGVVIQVKGRPNPRYKILGLGSVVADDGARFRIEQYGSPVERAENAVAVSLPGAAFDASNTDDSRARTLKTIAQRRGQPAFRKALLAAYDGKCAITGCSVIAILEAAHVVPYLGDHTNHVQNGMLLRADVHTLFDLGLIAIEPVTYQVQVSDELRASDYGCFHGTQLRLPKHAEMWPDTKALAARPLR